MLLHIPNFSHILVIKKILYTLQFVSGYFLYSNPIIFEALSLAEFFPLIIFRVFCSK